jgi:hypothetical protein
MAQNPTVLRPNASSIGPSNRPYPPAKYMMGLFELGRGSPGALVVRAWEPLEIALLLLALEYNHLLCTVHPRDAIGSRCPH